MPIIWNILKRELSCLYNFYRLHIINVSYTMNDCRMSKHTNSSVCQCWMSTCAGARQLYPTHTHTHTVYTTITYRKHHFLICLNLNGCAACKCARTTYIDCLQFGCMYYCRSATVVLRIFWTCLMAQERCSFDWNDVKNQTAEFYVLCFMEKKRFVA